MGWFGRCKTAKRPERVSFSKTLSEYVARHPLPVPSVKPPKPEHAELWQQCVVAMLSNVDLSKIATISKHELALAQICRIADDIVGRRKNIKTEQQEVYDFYYSEKQYKAVREEAAKFIQPEEHISWYFKGRLFTESAKWGFPHIKDFDDFVCVGRGLRSDQRSRIDPLGPKERDSE